MANIKTGSSLTTAQRPFSVVINSDAYKSMINRTLGNEKTVRTFIADITSAVASNYTLQKCDPKTILYAGLQAQRLNLPLTQGLGFVYLVPYGNQAQFQVGYKGLIQLAQRTGQFEKIGVKEVHEGELKGYDEFGDELVEFNHEYDNNNIIGYFAYFKLLNGFKKTLYWSKERCLKHAEKYSKSFRSTSDTNLWRDQIDLMSCKTVLKQLISKYAPMSVELQQAILSDQAVIKENGEYQYVDNDTGEITEQELTKATEQESKVETLDKATETKEYKDFDIE